MALAVVAVLEGHDEAFPSLGDTLLRPTLEAVGPVPRLA